AALGLRGAGLDVCIVDDAVGSRAAAQRDRDLALARMTHAGCFVAGTETVLFEWTGRATDERFRPILALVKSF
ncbi:MAG: isochorismatase family protein, partial [Burkholderiaceae bacterium]